MKPPRSTLSLQTADASAACRATAVSDLYLIAGVDGAGKSSLAGAAMRANGADYFDPDEAATALMRADPRLGRPQARVLAGRHGERLLERAIARRSDHVVETTLASRTLPATLSAAARRGIAIHLWYVGLSGPEAHVRRLRLRGDRDIDAAAIRRKDEHSRIRLIELLPSLAALRLYDNSAEADPRRGVAPTPLLLLHLRHGRLVGPDNLSATPVWARPIVAAALKRTR